MALKSWAVVALAGATLPCVLSFASTPSLHLGQRSSNCAASLTIPALRPAAAKRQSSGGPPGPASPAMQFGLGNLFNKKVTLQESGIVPDVFPEMFDEKTVLRVKYPAWVKSAVDLTSVASFGGTPTRGVGEVTAGQVVTPTQVQDQPVVGWEAEEGMYYTLVMVDPDAPSAVDPKMREWAHWVRVNIPGDNLPCDGKDGGDNLKAYVGSGPPKGTGEHRYVFLLFEQPDGEQDFPENERIPFVASGREKWSVAKFAEANNLGKPIAWNFYKAAYDNYVPELYARLKGELKDDE